MFDIFPCGKIEKKRMIAGKGTLATPVLPELFQVRDAKFLPIPFEDAFFGKRDESVMGTCL